MAVTSAFAFCLLVVLAAAQEDVTAWLGNTEKASYYGTKCRHEDTYLSRTDNTTCEFGGVEHCLPGVIPNCIRWEEGTWQPSLTPGPIPDYILRNLTQRVCTSSLVDGEFTPDEDRGGEMWYPYTCGLLLPMTSEFLHYFKGKTILFMGDSTIRHLFLRLVAHLRGQTVLYEHYFHCHAVYNIGPAGDHFRVLDQHCPMHGHADLPSPEVQATPLDGVQVVFMWSVTGRIEWAKVKNMTAAPDYMIFGSSYWTPGSPDELRQDLLASPLPPPRLFYVAFPNFKKGTTARKRWVHTARHLETYRAIYDRVKYISYADMLDTSPYGRVDWVHWQCSYGAYNNKQVQEGVKRASDCHDFNNYSLVRFILTLMMAPMIGSTGPVVQAAAG